MAEQGYNLKYTGKEIDALLDKANDMDSSAQVPSGGTSGQVLTKKSGTNYDAEWETPGSSLPSGGTSGQVLTKNSSTDGDASWKTFETPDAGETAVFEIVMNSANHFTTTENYDDVIAAVNAGKVPMLLEKTYGYVFYLLNYANQSGGSSRWIRLFTAPTNIKKTQGVIVWNALSGKSGGILSYSEMEYGGLPAGGSAGQALVKSSASDFAVKWATIQSGGGSSGSDDLLVVKISGLGTSASPFSADKTLDEVIEAYQAGKAVIAVTKDIPLLSGTSQNNSLRCMVLSYYYYYNSTSSSTGITTKYEVAYFCSSYTVNSMGGTHCYVQNVYIMWRRNTPSSGSVVETISSSTSTTYTIPYGGKTGQILSKNDDNSYSFNMKWIDPPSGSSGGGITKTELWVSSTNSPSSQDGTTITLSDSFYNYKMVYVCFASKGGTLVTNMQFLNRDKPYMGTYAWTLVAANGSSRAMRLVNETSIQFYNGTNSNGEADATACIITGIYGIN